MEAWKKAEEEKPLLPSRQELKQSFTPPAYPEKKQEKNHLLRTQLVVCGLLLAALLAGRYWHLPFYESCRAAFLAQMEKGVEFTGEGELLRFANAQAETKEEKPEGTEEPEQEKEEAVLLTGAGGIRPAKRPNPPQGYKEEAYWPEFELQRPLEQFRITSPYGWRTHPKTGKSDFHTGLDMAAPEGTAIHAAADGWVIKTARGPSYGNNVLVLHQNGAATRYCHMQYVFVRPGEAVKAGTVLGTVGQTGMVTGPHLHLELLCNDVGYDPAPALGLA